MNHVGRMSRLLIASKITASGNSGNTTGMPHLHFGAYQSWPAREGFDMPVNFRSAEGASTSETA